MKLSRGGSPQYLSMPLIHGSLKGRSPGVATRAGTVGLMVGKLRGGLGRNSEIRSIHSPMLPSSGVRALLHMAALLSKFAEYMGAGSLACALRSCHRLVVVLIF